MTSALMLQEHLNSNPEPENKDQEFHLVLERLTDELQNGMMQIRLVPMETMSLIVFRE